MAAFLEVIPLLACEDIDRTHDFLVSAFGFESAGVVRNGDGRAVHGEVRAGGRRIWLHPVSPEHGLGSPRNLGASGGGNVVLVDDVDAHFAKAEAAGATILSEPVDQDYGQREYGANDPDGHSWWFATLLETR